MHVLTPTIFDLLERAIGQLGEGENSQPFQFPGSMAQSERYLAAQLNGERYNIGEKLWLAGRPVGHSAFGR